MKGGARIDLGEFQRRAAVVGRGGLGSDSAVLVPLLALAGRIGWLQDQYRKLLRDGAAHERFGDLVGEGIGDLIYHSAALAAELGLDLDEIGSLTLARLGARHTAPTGTVAFYDDAFPPDERFPRRISAEFVEINSERGPLARMSVDGGQVGALLSDRAHEEIGYRWPASVLAHLAASPTHVRSWASAVEWLPDLAAEASVDDVLTELAGRPATVSARLGYLRQKTIRHDNRWQVADTRPRSASHPSKTGPKSHSTMSSASMARSAGLAR